MVFVYWKTMFWKSCQHLGVRNLPVTLVMREAMAGWMALLFKAGCLLRKDAIAWSKLPS